MRRERAGQFLPIGEGADAQDRIAIETRWRVAGHFRRLVDRKGDRQSAIAVASNGLREAGEIFRAEIDIGTFGPAHDRARKADLPRRGHKVLRRLHFLAQRLVGNRHSVAHPQNIPDLQAGDSQRRGQLTVEQSLLQPLFTAKHIELGSRGDHVDDLRAADDLHLVDGEVALVRQPCERDRTVLHQEVRIVDPDGRVGVFAHHAVFEAMLPIVDQRRRIAFDVHPRQRHLVDPFRRVPVNHLVTRMGRSGQRQPDCGACGEGNFCGRMDRLVVHEEQLTAIAAACNRTSAAIR